MESGAPTNKTSNSFNLRLDYRFIIGVLLAIILIMLLLWRPWEQRFGADARTVTVTGETKITAEPDEYVFMPVYQFENADRETALAELSKKSDEIVGKLKELGVSETSIKTSSDGNDYPMFDKDGTVPAYSLRLTVTVTVNEKELAQKVQNYLAGTAPIGAISPQYGFSESKRKELENKARDEATKDARGKAEQSAKNLGFTIGTVKEVTDGANFGGGNPPLYRDMVTQDSASVSSLGLQPGENDLSYQVTVVYFVK